MASTLRSLFNDQPGNTRAKVIAIYALLLLFNLGAWAWAVIAFHRFPVLLGTAFLASSDADFVTGVTIDVTGGN